ncbi:MAG: peptide chain release factor 1 [Gemmatimonadota bacterium]
MREHVLDARLEKRLLEVVERFEIVSVQLTDPEVVRDLDRLRRLGQERAELEPVVDAYREIRTVLEELRGAREIAAETEDPEMRAMADDEVEGLEARYERLTGRARRLLIPKDPLEDRPAVVEVRAGTGGDEAGLFAADLMRMYRRVAERNRWSVELLDLSEGIPGSVKEAIFLVKGRGAYGKLRHESGVHRVQRVPETESQGRIHTSAATVAVLPEAEEVDLKIEPNDLRIDVFRSSGPGGQSVNTTDSAVRITHVPTGVVATCQDEKSQLKNKTKAMKVLRSRLLDRMIATQEAERASERRTQIGTGDRSAKIRTYNFPQNRVTDHRINLTLHRLEEILDGDMDELLEALALAQEEERLEEMAG